MLSYDSKLDLFQGKLRSQWMRPYVIPNFFPYGAVKIQDLESGDKFKVNGKRLKQFLELLSIEDVECLTLYEPSPDK